MRTLLPVGPQKHWDARAAANFVGGGLGGGVIVFAAFAGAHGPALAALFGAGLVLVAIGLVCVFTEIGRPRRALNVFLNARRSWMSREAYCALVLFASAGAAAYLDHRALVALAAVAASAFVYCQASMLRAARGIPAWRDPRLTPFVLATSLAEGAGLFWLCAMHHGAGTLALLVAFGVVVVVRLVAWLAYRRSIASHASAPALAALDRAGAVLRHAGTLLPLVLVAFVASGLAGESATLPLAAAAGAAAAVAGAWVKVALVLGAGHPQAFALPHLPVRAARP